MRRLHFVSGLIILILLLSLAACGGGSEGAVSEAGSEEASAPAAEEAAAEEEAAPEEEPTAEPAEEEAAADEEADEEEPTAEPAEEPTAAPEEEADAAADEEASNEEGGDEEGGDEGAIEPIFAEMDPANFTNSTVIDNEWMPMRPGMHWAYVGETVEDGESVPHRIEFTVTDFTKEIDGVRNVVAWVVDISDGEVVESELSFYAQDDEGTVWYFGEYPEEYEEGELVAAPTWVSGQEEAVAGVKMVKEPQLDMPVYFQGWAPAVEWSDFGIVARMGEEVCVTVDCYTDVLVIDESSLDEVGAFQQKFYAPGVGNISVEWTGEDATQETLEMVDFVEKLDDDAMAEVHQLAMEQEARAYENSPDVYGQTAPME